MASNGTSVMAAAERLDQEGISVTVVNARFVKPLDGDLIGAVAKQAKCLLTVEEGSAMGGFGSAVLEFLSEKGLLVNLPTKCMGLPDWFIEQGPQDVLREKYGLTAVGIYEQAKQLFTHVSVGSMVN